MAKRQKCLRSMLFKNSVSDDTPLTQTSSSSEGCTFRPCLTPLEIAVSQWKDVWYIKFDWIDFDSQTGRVFCKVCRQKGVDQPLPLEATLTLGFQHFKTMERV
jgi:hypothetical protein